MKWVGQVAGMWKWRSAHRASEGKAERKRKIGRLGHKWEDNSQMDVQERVWGGVDLSGSK
jgi:hypothetical protein